MSFLPSFLLIFVAMGWSWYC